MFHNNNSMIFLPPFLIFLSPDQCITMPGEEIKEPETGEGGSVSVRRGGV